MSKASVAVVIGQRVDRAPAARFGPVGLSQEEGISSEQGTRVYDPGDLEQPGPLASVLMQASAMPAGFHPRSTHMTIIAILIGLLTEPR